MYLTYDEYRAVLPQGKVSEEDFIAYESVAESAIDSYTFSILRKDEDVLTSFSDAVKRCMAHQVDFMGAFNSLDEYCSEAGKVIQSRSINVGGTSESIVYKTDSRSRLTDGGLRLSPLVVAPLAPIRAVGRRM